MNNSLLSLNQAAKIAQKSPSTIHKYLKNGTISYVSKDDSGYKIDLSELKRVFPNANSEQAKNANDRIEKNRSENSNEYISLKSEIEILREKEKIQNERILEHKNRISELQDERDKWQEQAQKLLLTYEADKKSSEQKKEEIVPKKQDQILLWLLPLITALGILLTMIALKNI